MKTKVRPDIHTRCRACQPGHLSGKQEPKRCYGVRDYTYASRCAGDSTGSTATCVKQQDHTKLVKTSYDDFFDVTAEVST